MLKITVYEDAAGEWRWQAMSGSRTVADGGEGYSRRRRCVAAVHRFLTLVRTTDYRIEVED